MMLSARSISTSAGSISSSIYGGSSSLLPQEEVLCQLKSALFGANLLELLDSRPEETAMIKSLLQQVDVLSAPSSVVSFVG